VAVRCLSSPSPLEGADPTQVELMREECILVDEADQVTGHASKYDTHLLENINKGGALHRAFSVFLFDTKGRLLLQKRASEKITFPDTWTNTCCSHPLYRPEELEEGENHVGARRAACRKLDHELGISSASVNPDDLLFLTRILYKAPSDELWGEHEVDYILFCQKDLGDLDSMNPNEVSEVQYVTRDDLRSILDTRTMRMASGAVSPVKLTPWFEMIARSGLLFSWWDQLDEIVANKALPDVEAREKIFDMGLFETVAAQ